MRQTAFLLSILLLLAACGAERGSKPTAVESLGAAETEHPVPSGAAPPAETTPLPLPEGSPLTLAGEELASAVMIEGDSPYDFSAGEAANLEGWFRLLGFRAEEPFYEYHDQEGELLLRLWYDEEKQIGVGLRCNGGEATCGFRLPLRLPGPAGPGGGELGHGLVSLGGPLCPAPAGAGGDDGLRGAAGI